MDLSLEKLKQAVSLREQIHALEAKINALFGGSGQKAAAPGRRRGGRRKMSAATRAKLSAAAKARWAKGTFGRKPKANKSRVKKRRSGLTAAGRRRLSESMKARWAARRRAGK